MGISVHVAVDAQFVEGNQMKIYFYDEKINKLVLKSEVNLDTVGRITEYYYSQNV